MADPTADMLRKTPLHALHVELGARMVAFAGYEMPVQYARGVLGEHLHTRAAAGLFDVSHMGQAYLVGRDHASVARAFEALVPGDIAGLAPGQQRYTVLLNEAGGIIDDLMVTRPADPALEGRLYLVVNAACKDGDFAHMESRLPAEVRLERLESHALVALQGPKAVEVFASHCPPAAGLAFMTAAPGVFDGHPVHVSRSGYTGEDGVEVSLQADAAEAVVRTLLAHDEVAPVGLGARDSLRLEAGLCLYGHDIDETTSPVEAGLGWAIARRRRDAGDFPGADRILRELRDGPSRRRVGLLPEGRAPAREHTEIRAAGARVGEITSGGFGPTVGGPVAMGYVAAERAGPDTPLDLIVRGTPRPARVAKLPFVPHRYVR